MAENFNSMPEPITKKLFEVEKVNRDGQQPELKFGPRSESVLMMKLQAFEHKVAA